MRTEAARGFAAAAAFLGASGVAVGAFAAHALADRLPPEMLEIFETGARYHLIHGVALLALALVLDRWPGRLAHAAAWCILAGTAVFAGTLYVLALSGVRTWGAVTPIGGVLLIAGWTLLFLHLLRTRTSAS